MHSSTKFSTLLVMVLLSRCDSSAESDAQWKIRMQHFRDTGAVMDDTKDLVNLLESMMDKVAELTDKVDGQQQQMNRLSQQMTENVNHYDNNINDLSRQLTNQDCAVSQNQQTAANASNLAAQAYRQPKDCAEVYANGLESSGVYYIYVDGHQRRRVYCDMQTDGGGWLVFQRRKDGSISFNRGWADYEAGFGLLEGEHWLGNRLLNQISKQGQYTLRIDLEDEQGNKAFAEYTGFKVGPPAEKYKLTIGSYRGNAGDSLMPNPTATLNGMKFSTGDADNDNNPNGDCAHIFKSGWWFNACFAGHLNGLYLPPGTDQAGVGIIWYTWKKKVSLKVSEMKIRRQGFGPMR